jgi:heptosyltransferase-2/heptosyltransferase-3
MAALRRTGPGPVYVCEWKGKSVRRVHRLLAMSGVDRRRVINISDPTKVAQHWSDWKRDLGEMTPRSLRAQDYPPPQGDWPPRLTLLASELAEASVWLRDRGWTGRPLILVQPGNHRSASRKRGRWRRLNKDDKAWPIERWGELLRRVQARTPQAQLLLRGAPTEVPMLKEVAAASGLADVAALYLPLRPTFALCTMAHSMISVDTGPAHAAAAVGLPLVVICGVQPPGFWAPRSATGSPVLTVGGPPLTLRADQVPVEAVFNAWCRLLGTADERQTTLALR